jgi:hypothetical protein
MVQKRLERGEGTGESTWEHKREQSMCIDSRESTRESRVCVQIEEKVNERAEYV